MSQSAERVLAVIEFVAASPRTLTEVSEHLQVHKSTALRTLQTLHDSGFARRLPDGRYTIGFNLIALAQRAIEDIDTRAIAHPFLVDLAARLGHTVHLAQLVSGDIVYTDKIDGEGSVKMGSRVGLALTYHTAAAAKVILAYCDDEVVRKDLIAKATFERFTPRTIPTPDALRMELAKIRKRGWAEDDGEQESYINCIALPVFDALGRVTSGISMTSLSAVAPLPSLREQIPDLQKTANAISQLLGWQDSAS